MLLSENIRAAFAILVARGIDGPVYAVVKTETGQRLHIYREAARQGQPLETGEHLAVFTGSHPKVTVTLAPDDIVDLVGPAPARSAVVDGLRRKLKVCGGSHQSCDDFRFGAADWSRVTDYACLVRCGSYPGGWRKPSREAIEWVSDPARYLTHPEHRQHVLAMLSQPLPTGERLTIRRVFEKSREICQAV